MPSFYYKFLTKKNITNYAIFVVAVVVVVSLLFTNEPMNRFSTYTIGWT